MVFSFIDENSGAVEKSKSELKVRVVRAELLN